MSKFCNKFLINFIKISVATLTVLTLTGCGKKQTEGFTAACEQLENAEFFAAENGFRAAIEAGEDDLTSCYRGLGISLMGENRYEEAVECFIEALHCSGSKPTDIDYDINYYLGVCYHKLGRYEEAKERYDAIIVLKPKETDAYMQRAVENMYLDDMEAAGADFDKALSLDKKNYTLYIDIYNLMKEAGHTDIGTGYLTEALNENDKNMSDYDKGYINYCLGYYSTAKEYLEAARNDGKKDSNTLLLLGQCYEEMNERSFAINLYRKYLETSPDATVYNQLAVALMAEGRYEEAADATVAGIEIAESECRQQLLFNRIVAYEYLGDFSKANELSAQYMVEYPYDDTMARERLFLQTR